tara:strand:+ start:6558 stop:7673 length:1116 start_codon:yes stop_codon:yes gene_type:complete
MNIAVIGSNGFISKNLIVKLRFSNNKIFKINRSTSKKKLEKILLESDIIYHLAGVNRPKVSQNFENENVGLTKKICNFLLKKTFKKEKTIIFSSSTQIFKKSSYGISKKKCEKLLINLKKKNKINVVILRLPNIFGKWCKPNYNSVVSTFCYNISRKKKVNLFNEHSKINLLYIDDLIDLLIKYLKIKVKKFKIINKFKFSHNITVKKLYEKIKQIDEYRDNLFIPNLKNKFSKDIYSTYVSMLPKSKFVYNLKSNKDFRGDFIETLKTNYSGQISILIAKKNKVRGHHFHHSKVEKFFVIKGKAIFKMIHIIDRKEVKYELSDKKRIIVETIPGWQHYIKNTGSTDLIVLLWSNEVFNVKKPDTFKIEIN